jgi:CheY-specific phosphatase CheX
MSHLETELYRATALTFEELAYLLPTGELDEQPSFDGVKVAASVGFRGPFGGTLVVTVNQGLLPTLAANMLGEDDVLSEQQHRDALGEIANVICGNVLPRIAGTREVFRIIAPRSTNPAVEPKGESQAARVRFGVDEGWVDVVFFVDTDGHTHPAILQ